MSPDPGRTLYAAYIKDQLDIQDARKTSIEQRGLAVITTSGALVTLLFGLTTLTTKRGPTYDIPNWAASCLIVALGLFILAAVSAIVTNVPRSYQGVTVDALRAAVKGRRWEEDTEAEASKMVALTQLTVLEAAKKVNTQKGRFLIAGMVLEIFAVALVGVAMGIVVWD